MPVSSIYALQDSSTESSSHAVSEHDVGTTGGCSTGAVAVESPAPRPAAHSHGSHEGPLSRGVTPFWPHS